MKFLDQAKIYIASGHGGSGSISFRREAHVPFGGPDGGNGGRGGDVIALCSDGLNTLIDFRYQQHFKARPGEGGKGRDRSGISGKDVILRLPLGTQILDETNNFIIADMIKIGQKVILAKGGEGGKGNAFFKTSTNQSPRKSQPGGELEEKWIWLRLKLIEKRLQVLWHVFYQLKFLFRLPCQILHHQQIELKHYALQSHYLLKIKNFQQ